MINRKIHINFLGILLIASISLFYSFEIDIETEFTEEEMLEIHQEVEERVKAFTARERRNCREELMEAVEAKVDSILMYDIKELLSEDNEIQDNTPERPLPPEKPELLEPKDNTPLQPLIKNESEVFNTTNKIE